MYKYIDPDEANKMYTFILGERLNGKITAEKQLVEKARKETAREILNMLYDMGIDKEICEYCRIFDVNGISLAKQICKKYGVDLEE